MLCSNHPPLQHSPSKQEVVSTTGYMLANASTVRDYQQLPNLHLNGLCWWHRHMDFHLVAFVFIPDLLPFRNPTLSLGVFTLDEIHCGSDRRWAVQAQSWRAPLQLGFLSYQADEASTWDRTFLWWKHFLPGRTGLDTSVSVFVLFVDASAHADKSQNWCVCTAS